MMKKSGNISISLIAQRCVIAFFVLISAAVMAQTRGTLTVVKDARIDTLIAKRLELSRTGGPVAASISSGMGYRVQFFTGSNRTEAYSAQSRFNELYPDYKTYIIYNDPNFKVRAGDFRTKLEATRLMEQLRGQFTSLFIISEKINLSDSK